jgi:hypothetical protein
MKGLVKILELESMIPEPLSAFLAWHDCYTILVRQAELLYSKPFNAFFANRFPFVCTEWSHICRGSSVICTSLNHRQTSIWNRPVTDLRLQTVEQESPRLIWGIYGLLYSE